MRELFKLQHLAKGTKINSPFNTYLSSLGIKKPFTGTRAGVKVSACKSNRTFQQIPVRITPRLPSDNSTSTTSYVNTSNLITVPLVKSTSKLATINCQSICNKTTSIIDHLIENDIDIAVLTETWLSAGNRDQPIIGELQQYGHTLHHQPVAVVS